MLFYIGYYGTQGYCECSLSLVCLANCVLFTSFYLFICISGK